MPFTARGAARFSRFLTCRRERLWVMAFGRPWPALQKLTKPWIIRYPCASKVRTSWRTIVLLRSKRFLLKYACNSNFLDALSKALAISRITCEKKFDAEGCSGRITTNALTRLTSFRAPSKSTPEGKRSQSGIVSHVCRREHAKGDST